MKFAVSALIVAAVAANSFSDFSFLDSPASLSAAEDARANFIKQSMKLAKARSIKTRGYFNARDQAAKLKKYWRSVYATFKKAGSLANAKKALAKAANKAHAERKKIHFGATGTFDKAALDFKVCEKRSAASTKVFARFTNAAAADKRRGGLNQAAANKAAGPMKKDIAALKKARAHRTASAAALKKSGALLKKAKNAAAAAKQAYTKALAARTKANKHHLKSWKESKAAINRRAKARAAAVKAHIAVRNHAQKGWMYL
jgi:hypothetical protein